MKRILDDKTMQGRGEVVYPCRWLYKVISMDPEGDVGRITALIGEEQCRIRRGRVSRAGTYTSLDVEVEVRDQEHRDRIYAQILELETVRLVL